jgi:ParB-like chromosome segregation protein Spo0J
MAFSVTADQARQEQVWDNVSRSQLDEPYQIRRILTENSVRASDRRAQFIGLDAYEQAGGTVMRNLFEHDDGGWLQDVPLLDRLVTEKLKAEAETIAAEGWKWIAVAGNATDWRLRRPGVIRSVTCVPASCRSFSGGAAAGRRAPTFGRHLRSCRRWLQPARRDHW